MLKKDQDVQDEVIDARRSLLISASNLFAHQGYSATGVQQITDAAKVNKAMLYYYYNNKESLYDLLIEEGIRAVDAAVSAAEMQTGTLQEKLQVFVLQYISIAVDHPDIARIIFREVMGGGERARETVVEHFSDSFQRLALLLAASENSGELLPKDTTFLAYSLFGMATMFIAGHFLVERPLDVVSLSEQIVALFLYGVGVDNEKR